MTRHLVFFSFIERDGGAWISILLAQYWASTVVHASMYRIYAHTFSRRKYWTHGMADWISLTMNRSQIESWAKGSWAKKCRDLSQILFQRHHSHTLNNNNNTRNLSKWAKDGLGEPDSWFDSDPFFPTLEPITGQEMSPLVLLVLSGDVSVVLDPWPVCSLGHSLPVVPGWSNLMRRVPGRWFQTECGPCGTHRVTLLSFCAWPVFVMCMLG